MNKLLNKFWIRTIKNGNEFNFEIGVTAYSENDAMNILKEKIKEEINIESIMTINSIQDLEQNHVVPNMEEFISRGIWFPKGFR